MIQRILRRLSFSASSLSKSKCEQIGLSRNSEFYLKGVVSDSLQKGEIPKAFKNNRASKDTILSNGIRVHSENLPTGITTVSMSVKAGSRYETYDTSGTAHFLEHLNFKGTRNRTKLDIEKGTEDFGGNLNAFTTRDCTSFIITTLDHKVDKGFNLISDMTCNSLYTQEALEHERHTIHSEVLNCHLDHWDTILETSHFLCFRDSVMGLPILGRVENINKITRDMVLNYHKNNYYGSNITISAAGGVDHDYLCELVEKNMSHLPLVPENPAVTQEAIFSPGKMWIDQPDMKENHYCILFEAPCYTNQEYLALYALNFLISESEENSAFLSSLGMKQAFQIYSHRSNLIKNGATFKSTYLAYEDSGLFSLYYSSKGEDAEMVENLLRDFMNDLAFNITEEDVERVKFNLWMTSLQIDSSFELSQENANHFIYFGHKVDRETWARLVSKFCTKENLQQIAMKYFMNRKYAFVGWGDIKNTKNDSKYEFLRVKRDAAGNSLYIDLN